MILLRYKDGQGICCDGFPLSNYIENSKVFSYQRRARKSASPQRHRRRSSNERHESFDARYTLYSHGVCDGEKGTADSYQRADFRYC